MMLKQKQEEQQDLQEEESVEEDEPSEYHQMTNRDVTFDNRVEESENASPDRMAEMVP